MRKAIDALHKYCRKDIRRKDISSHFACDNNIFDATQAIDLIAQSYLDHSIIGCIKTTIKNRIPSITSSNNFCGTNAEEIFKLLSARDTKKAPGFDITPS